MALSDPFSSYYAKTIANPLSQGGNGYTGANDPNSSLNNAPNQANQANQSAATTAARKKQGAVNGTAPDAGSPFSQSAASWTIGGAEPTPLNPSNPGTQDMFSVQTPPGTGGVGGPMPVGNNPYQSMPPSSLFPGAPPSNDYPNTPPSNYYPNTPPASGDPNVGSAYVPGAVGTPPSQGGPTLWDTTPHGTTPGPVIDPSTGLGIQAQNGLLPGQGSTGAMPGFGPPGSDTNPVLGPGSTNPFSMPSHGSPDPNQNAATWDPTSGQWISAAAQSGGGGPLGGGSLKDGPIDKTPVGDPNAGGPDPFTGSGTPGTSPPTTPTTPNDPLHTHQPNANDPPDTNIPMPPDTTGGTGIPNTPPPGGYIPAPMKPPNTEDPAIAAEWYSRFANVDPAEGGDPVFAMFAGRPDLVNKLRASGISDPKQIAGWLKTQLANEPTTPSPTPPPTPPPDPNAPKPPTSTYDPNTDYGKDPANDFYNFKPTQLDENGLPVKPTNTEDPKVAANWYAQFANVDPSKGGDPIFAYFRNRPDLVDKLRVSGISDPKQIAGWLKQQIASSSNGGAGGPGGPGGGSFPFAGNPGTAADPNNPFGTGQPPPPAPTSTPNSAPAPAPAPPTTPSDSTKKPPPAGPVGATIPLGQSSGAGGTGGTGGAGSPSPASSPASPATTPPATTADYLRGLMNPQFQSEQSDLARQLNAQAAVTGDSQAGGFTQGTGPNSFNRQMSNLVANQGSRLSDYTAQASESQKARDLQQYLGQLTNTTALTKINSEEAVARLNDETTRLGIKTNDDLQRWLSDKNNALAKYGIDTQALSAHYAADAQQAGIAASGNAAYNAAVLNSATQKTIAEMNNAADSKRSQMQYDLGVLGINADNFRFMSGLPLQYLQLLMSGNPPPVQPTGGGVIPYGP